MNDDKKKSSPPKVPAAQQSDTMIESMTGMKLVHVPVWKNNAPKGLYLASSG